MPNAVENSAAPKSAQPAFFKAPAVQYLGFETTARGREYTLRAMGAEAPRNFVVLIPEEAFASRAVRYQDGPDLCFRRLQRDLTAAPDLPADSKMVLSEEEIGDYRAGREQPAAERRGRRNGV